MIVIVDTGVANRHSIRNAFEFIGVTVKVSRDPDDIRDASKLVIPGVGAFAPGIRSLRAIGLVDLLTNEVIVRGKPVLGICLGMQLFAEKSLEDGEHEGFGWIPGVVRRIKPDDLRLKVPHVGFNDVGYQPECPIFRGLPLRPDFYFVHGYHLDGAPDVVAAQFEYGGLFTAAIQKDNIFGVQFHPEKSQSAGLLVLKNFARLG